MEKTLKTRPALDLGPPMLSLLLLVIGLHGFAIFASQADFISILGFGFLSFFAYGRILRTGDIFSKSLIYGVVSILSLSLCFYVPSLSDDYFRFLWDGHVSNLGLSPYSMTPTALTVHSSYMTELFPNLNSPDYFSPYPLINQGIFQIADAMGETIYFKLLWMRVIFLLIHLAGLFAVGEILVDCKLPKSHMIIYYLNPLVLIEGLINLHAEILAASFLAWAILGLLRSKLWQLILFYGLSTATKLNPLLLFPSLFVSVRPQKRSWFFIFCGIWILILLGPMLWEFQQVGQSLTLYVKKFEFNAGPYYFIRWLWMGLSGYNPINVLGPLLASVAAILILWRSLIKVNSGPKEVLDGMGWLFLIYLVGSTTVHPWYIIPLIFFWGLTGRISIVVWSCLIFVSYSHYWGERAGESYGFIFLEWIVFGVLLLVEVSKNNTSIEKNFGKVN